MTILLTFFAAFRAGDLWARAVAVGLALVAGIAFVAVMIARHDAGVTARALDAVRKANHALETAADAKQREIMACPVGKWNREGDKCDP
jgi:Kef-type K+ transport system membrane component KefB